MLNLSSSCQYTLRALVGLARQPLKEFYTIHDIAHKEGIPYNYLSKLLQRLIKGNVLESNVGPSGGVRLPRKGRKTPLATIIGLIDGRPSFDRCALLGTKGCVESRFCPINLECQKMDKTAWVKLKRTKLEDFCDGK